MVWGRLESTFARHPKVKRLARRLSVTKPEARGLVATLWAWAYDFASDGNLTSFDDEAIYDGAGADELRDEITPEAFVGALVEVGLLDHAGDGPGPGYVIHDWLEYAGTYRAAVSKAKQRARSKDTGKTSRPKSEDGGRTRGDSPSRQDRTDRQDTQDRTDTPAPTPLGLTHPPGPSPGLPGVEDPPVCVIPCSGSGPKEFTVTEAMVAEWSGDFPGVDVRAVVLRVKRWSIENAKKRKTARNLRSWITGTWLTREQDKGSRPSRPPQKGASPADDILDANRAWLERQDHLPPGALS